MITTDQIKDVIGKKSTKITLISLISIITVPLFIWSIPALYFSNLPWHWLRTILSICFAIVIPAALIFIPGRLRTMTGILLVEIVIVIWYILTPASNDRDWKPSVAVLPEVNIDGNKITVKNIRDFDYRTEKDFTIHYYDKTFDLNKLDTLDYFLSYWDGNTAIAHSMFSFGFQDEGHLCVSVETRLEKGEPQTGLRGIFNQYELIYILADETDIIRLRTNFRKEQVYMYPANIKPEIIRKFFLNIMAQVDRLEQHPRFYNTIKHNCLTTLMFDFRKAYGEKYFFKPKDLCNGYSAEIAYKNGRLKTFGLSFPELKKICHINQYVTNDPDAKTDFSQKIRKFENQFR